MLQIRTGVFETNSSSSHSLVYRADSRTGKKKKSEKNHRIKLYDFYGDDPKNGILAIHFGNYGWDGDPCSSFRTKLSYLLTQIVGGWGLSYYKHLKEDIRINSQEDWNKVINEYVMEDPEVLKILNFVKEKVPKIKGFKFYWYRPVDDRDIQNDYEWYKERKNIENDIEMPDISDKFFHDYDEGHREYLIGFGNVDHQSSGYLSALEDLDTYLFDDNMWVIITNDNRW